MPGIVRLRLQRLGKKKVPFYRIVAANSQAPRDGKFLEVVCLTLKYIFRPTFSSSVFQDDWHAIGMLRKAWTSAVFFSSIFKSQYYVLLHFSILHPVQFLKFYCLFQETSRVVSRWYIRLASDFTNLLLLLYYLGVRLLNFECNMRLSWYRKYHGVLNFIIFIIWLRDMLDNEACGLTTLDCFIFDFTFIWSVAPTTQ